MYLNMTSSSDRGGRERGRGWVVLDHYGDVVRIGHRSVASALANLIWIPHHRDVERYKPLVEFFSLGMRGRQVFTQTIEVPALKLTPHNITTPCIYMFALCVIQTNSCIPRTLVPLAVF